VVKDKKSVAVIPARGGSKGILRKNLTSLGGRPLISYSIEASSNAFLLHKTIISTDDLEIAEVCRGLGAEVPLLRPPELASDSAPMVGVLQHALSWLNSHEVDPDCLVLLQPTSPFRKSAHIDEAINLFYESNADTVVSITEVPHRFLPTSLLRSEGGLLKPFIESDLPVLRRQDKPRLYARNGPAILVVRSTLIRLGKLYGDKTIGYPMDFQGSIDIDSEEDLALAELFIHQ